VTVGADRMWMGVMVVVMRAARVWVPVRMLVMPRGHRAWLHSEETPC
jgi:hypothetical protein